MPVTRVLHRAGNVRALLPLASHPAVDAIEADVWVHGSRLVAHHDRPLGALPLTFGWGGLHPLRDAVPLEAILEAIAGRADVVIDLRSWFGDPAPDLARALTTLPDRAHLRVTCETWSIADRLRAWQPDIAIAYSVRSEAQLRAYLAGRDAGRIAETAVVVRHTLLHSADEVAALRARAGRVGVWTVDDVDRALTLVAWGIDDLVSNRLTVLGAI
ncbi:MAG: hypothetical protein EXR65_05120 [Dehalococcoidia bacterium]|nr:hypothetical protein [Dehalococcoidia bacterium]